METLKALEGATKQTDAENTGAGPAPGAGTGAPPDPASEQSARDWALIPYTLGGLFCVIEPKLAELYTEARCLAWGKAAHQVAVKYGWDSPANLPELALAASSFTFVLPTVFALRARIAELREAKDGNVWSKIGFWWRERAKQKAEARAARTAAMKAKAEKDAATAQAAKPGQGAAPADVKG